MHSILHLVHRPIGFKIRGPISLRLCKPNWRVLITYILWKPKQRGWLFLTRGRKMWLERKHLSQAIDSYALCRGLFCLETIKNKIRWLVQAWLWKKKAKLSSILISPAYHLRWFCGPRRDHLRGRGWGKWPKNGLIPVNL